MLLNPYILAAALAGAAASYAAGHYIGASRQEAQDIAASNAKLAETQAAYAKFENIVTKSLAAQLAAIRSTERIINHETQKIIERPVYRNVCLDADGVRLIEQARTSGNKTVSSSPAGKVP